MHEGARHLFAAVCTAALIVHCDSGQETDDGTHPDPTTGAGAGSSCQNGVRDLGEPCDGTDLGGEDCVSQGFDGGELGCTYGCTFDTSRCFGCGDGIKNGAEQCDGSDLGGESCDSQGLGSSGDLGCTDGCVFDTSDCCEPQCAGKNCGPDTCGGECGPCDSPSACCTGTCVAPPATCSCTCDCSLTSNPNCQGVQATSSAANADCNEVCQNACLGCGDVVNATGNCPPTATCS